jgi:hypothetical protein
MDSTHFDRLTRSLAVAASRRGVLAGLTSSLLVVLPLARVSQEVEARKKKRKNKRKKKRSAVALPPPTPGCTPNCQRKICGDDGCGGSCGDCTAPETCQGGICECVPESPATTCAPGCGARTNNCGQAVNCPCGSGQQCLANGSCAVTCTSNTQCQPKCAVCMPDLEGQQKTCIGYGPPCSTLQTCTRTRDCPQGTLCTFCSSLTDQRCSPLCTP